MAHFNFVIRKNAKWGHAGFYIDCYRMTSLVRYRKIFFYKKALHLMYTRGQCAEHLFGGVVALLSRLPPAVRLCAAARWHVSSQQQRRRRPLLLLLLPGHVPRVLGRRFQERPVVVHLLLRPGRRRVRRQTDGVADAPLPGPPWKVDAADHAAAAGGCGGRCRHVQSSVRLRLRQPVLTCQRPPSSLAPSPHSWSPHYNYTARQKKRTTFLL